MGTPVICTRLAAVQHIGHVAAVARAGQLVNSEWGLLQHNQATRNNSGFGKIAL